MKWDTGHKAFWAVSCRGDKLGKGKDSQHACQIFLAKPTKRKTFEDLAAKRIQRQSASRMQRVPLLDHLSQNVCLGQPLEFARFFYWMCKVALALIC